MEWLKGIQWHKICLWLITSVSILEIIQVNQLLSEPEFSTFGFLVSLGVAGWCVYITIMEWIEYAQSRIGAVRLKIEVGKVVFSEDQMAEIREHLKNETSGE